MILSSFIGKMFPVEAFYNEEEMVQVEGPVEEDDEEEVNMDNVEPEFEEEVEEGFY
jgi:hypothetical protein